MHYFGAAVLWLVFFGALSIFLSLSQVFDNGSGYSYSSIEKRGSAMRKVDCYFVKRQA